MNQWALDFDGNLARIVTSIKKAKAAGCRYRLGPELEVSGYSCEDHFLELDTFMHSEQSLAVLLQSDLSDGMLLDIGSPVSTGCVCVCVCVCVCGWERESARARDGDSESER